MWTSFIMAFMPGPIITEQTVFFDNAFLYFNQQKLKRAELDVLTELYFITQILNYIKLFSI